MNREIFTETGCLSRDKILQYKDGLLKRSDMHEIEKHLVDCNLCSEALEGLSMVSGLAALDEIKDRFSKTTKRDGYSSKNYMAIAASVVAITLLTYFAINQVKEVKNDQSAYEFKTLPNEVLNEPANNSLDGGKSKDSQAISGVPNENKTIKQLGTDANLANAPSLVLKDSPEEPAQKESLTITTTQGSESGANQGYTNTIATDYEKTSMDDVTESRAELDQVAVISKSPTREEVKKRKSSEQATPTVSEIESLERFPSKHESVTNSTYSLKMEDPISLYKKGKYLEAIIGFDKILMDFPDDENAMFHKGMSLYNLKRYQEALNILEPISQNTKSSFIQIAEYHTALCFEELGKKESALATYRKIVQRAGLYKDKAAKRIKAIE